VLANLGRNADAEPLLAQALAAEPDNEDGLALLARVLVSQRRFPDAHAADERLLAAHPDSLRGLLSMARVKCLLDRKPEGVPFARRALELYPDDVTALGTLADVLQQASHGSAEALRLLARARQVAPEDPYAYKLAGEIHLELQQYAAAESWLLRSLAIEPRDEWAVLYLGLARAGLGRFDESREQMAAALRLDPDPRVIDEVITHVEARGLPPHLAELYRMMLAARGRRDVSEPGSAGSDPELLAAQGKLAWRLYSRDSGAAGRVRAGELAAAVLAADPGNADARYVSARMLSDQGRDAEALPIARQLAAEGYPDAHLALLVTYTGTRDYEAALGVARERIAVNPYSPMYRRGEAHLLRCLKRNDEALAAARQAAELSPDAPEVQLELGLAAREAGDLELGEHALRAAVAARPDEGYPVAELALLLARAGRWAEAEELLAALTLDVPDPARLFHPCLGIYIAVVDQKVDEFTGPLEADEPTAAGLAESTRWLRLMLKALTLGLTGRLGQAGSLSLTQGALRKMPLLVGMLRKVPAPPDSEYAAVVRGFAGLMEAHGLPAADA
jgi:tetratricopeptide (TPR) repeat protein